MEEKIIEKKKEHTLESVRKLIEPCLKLPRSCEKGFKNAVVDDFKEKVNELDKAVASLINEMNGKITETKGFVIYNGRSKVRIMDYKYISNLTKTKSL